MSDNDDELTQAERIRRLMHRCDKEAEHVAELKHQTRAMARDLFAQVQEIDALVAERDRLRSERDEARREVCRMIALDQVEDSNDDGKVEIFARLSADESGWDCFNEDTK